MARTPRPIQRATTLLGFSPNQPRSTTWLLERRVEVGDVRPELRQVVGADEARPRVPPSERSFAERDLLGRPGRAARVAARRCASTSASPAAGSTSMPTFLPPSPSRPLVSSRNAMSPRDARSSIAVVSARRDVRAVHDHRPGRGGQVGRWGGHQDRRVVEVDRVLAVPAPVEERPAGQPEEDDRRADEPEDRVDLAGALRARRRARAWRRRRPSPARPRARRRSRPSRRCGSMSFSKIAWRSLVRQERRLEAGAGVQLDLAVLEVRLDVEEDDQAVVEALAPDAPLVDQGARLRLGLLGRRRTRRCPGCRRRPRRRSAASIASIVASASAIVAGDRSPA